MLAGQGEAFGQGGGELAELEGAQGGGEVGADRVGQRRHGVVLSRDRWMARAGTARRRTLPAAWLGLAAGGGPGGPGGGEPVVVLVRPRVAAGGGAGLGREAALVVAFEVELLFGVLGAGAPGVG